MHSALLVVDTTDTTSWPLFAQALQQAENAVSNSHATNLAKNVWMIALQPNGLLTLARIVAMADQYRVSCKTLFLDDEPQWIQSSFNSDSNSD